MWGKKSDYMHVIHSNQCKQRYSRLKCLLRVKGLGICFYLGWSGSILQFRQNRIKVGSKSWLLTCSSNITLSLPSYIDSALKRERTFCNRYLSQLYFCMQVPLTENIAMSKCCMDTNTHWDFCPKFLSN